MDIILVSENSELTAIIIQSMDDCIVKYKIKKMELFSMSKYSANENVTLEKTKSCLVFIDIRKTRDYIGYCKKIIKKFTYGYFGIITDSTDRFIMLINQFRNIHGCINMNDKLWKQQMLNILFKFERNSIKSNNAITIYEQSIYYIIPYEEINFIETIKGTHYCIVYCGDKKRKIRKSITDMKEVLDERFEVVKASTIININKVAMIDIIDKKIIFRNGQYCYYSEKYVEFIEKKVSINR